MHTTVLLPAVALAALLATSSAAIGRPSAPDPAIEGAGQAPAEDIAGATGLVFTAVEPCRLLDTRQPSERGGPIPADGERDFLVYDADLAEEQGGAPDGCGLPDDIRAVAINLTATRSAGRGYVTAWAFGAPRPATSNLNLIPGEDVSNQISVAINPGASEPELLVYSYAQTDLVADIVGYYTQPVSQPLDCTLVTSDFFTVPANGVLSGTSPQCPAGRTMTGGGCLSNSFQLRVVTSQLSMPPDSVQFCAYTNASASPHTFRVQGMCCRVPGN